MRKQLPFLIALIFLCAASFALVKIVKSQEPNPQNSSSDVEAVRRGGLREAARIKDHYVTSLRTSHWLEYDLESLTKNSANIIVGTSVDSAPQLSSDGRIITTEYRIKVQECLKGNLPTGGTIYVSLPGGKITFEDGTSAEVKTPDLEGMENGQTYALFLSPQPATSGAFGLTGGGQGLFELNRMKNNVKPHGHSVDLVQKHKDERVESFLDEIKAAVKKYPEPSTCCG